MSRRRERGYSLLEITVMLAVFGAVLAIFFVLTQEMSRWEKRLPVNYMRHPQVAAVMARLRRDVLDAAVNEGPYIDFGGLTNTKKTLILAVMVDSGTSRTVVWDFTQPGLVMRHMYNAGMKESTWIARGLPREFSADIDAVDFPGRTTGVRITAKDADGKIAIEQILVPRAYAP